MLETATQPSMRDVGRMAFEGVFDASLRRCSSFSKECSRGVLDDVCVEFLDVFVLSTSRIVKVVVSSSILSSCADNRTHHASQPQPFLLTPATLSLLESVANVLKRASNVNTGWVCVHCEDPLLSSACHSQSKLNKRHS